MDFLPYDSFRQIVARERVATRTYERTMDAMDAVDLLMEIEQMGDRVVVLRNSGRLSIETSHQLLAHLLSYYADPVSNFLGIVRVSRELRRYE